MTDAQREENEAIRAILRDPVLSRSRVSLARALYQTRQRCDTLLRLVDTRERERNEARAALRAQQQEHV